MEKHSGILSHCFLVTLTGTLESLDVLGALSELSNSLHEGDTSLLVGFEGGKNRTGHP